MLVAIPSLLLGKFAPLRDDFGAVANTYGITRTAMSEGGARQEVKTLPYYQKNYRFSLALNEAELTAFRRWYSEDLEGGVRAFLLNYRMTDFLLLTEARFIIGDSNPRITPHGRGVWRVSFGLEVREEGVAVPLPDDIQDLLQHISYAEFGSILALLLQATMVVKSVCARTKNSLGRLA